MLGSNILGARMPTVRMINTAKAIKLVAMDCLAIKPSGTKMKNPTHSNQVRARSAINSSRRTSPRRSPSRGAG